MTEAEVLALLAKQIEAHRRWAAEVLQECYELLARDEGAPRADSPVPDAPTGPEVSP